MRRRHIGFRTKNAAGSPAGSDDAAPRTERKTGFWRLALRVGGIGAVFGIFAVLPVLAVIHPPKAAAADTQYTLFFPNDPQTISDLVAAAKDGGVGSDDVNGVLTKTYVITKGGDLGTAILNLDPNNSNGEDLPTYTVDYYCSPADNYKLSLDKPDSSQPWVRYTLGVVLNDWRSNFPHDQTYDSYVGFEGNTFIGSMHFPQQINTTTGTVPSHDFDIPGSGGDHNIRTGIGTISPATEPDYGTYQFSDYDHSLPGNNTVLRNCMEQPIGHIHTNVITSNYNKLSKDQQDAWDKAVKDAGLGDTVAGAGPSGGGGGGGASDLGCEGTANPLSWIICPVVNDLLVPAIEKTDALITQQMVVPTQDIFCANQDKCDDYYSAWAHFRDIALGLLVAVAMVVIVAEGIGMEILDAYTIRKVLPRLLVAAICITLSWPLMNFAVTLSNNLGFGVRDLIVAPFHNLSDTINLNIFGSGAGNLIGGFVALLIGGAVVLIAGLGILLSYLATAGLAVLVAILVLVLRQLVIIMLVIVSPVAILAYVLPNTQRVYKVWWDTFLKTLLMFPMIAALIATGRVFSAVALSGNEGNLFDQIIGFVAYFGPYFMIPLTFRFAGGIMSGVGNFVNSRAQPGFQRLSQFRGNRMKSRAEDAFVHGKLLNDTRGGVLTPYSTFARRFNRATAGVGNLRNAGMNPRRMRERMHAGRSTRLTEEALDAMQNNGHVKQLTKDDDLVEAAMYASSQIRNGSTRGYDSLVREELTRRNFHNVNQGTALVRAARMSMNRDAFDTTMGIAQFGTSSGLTPTFSQGPDGELVISGGAAEGRRNINEIAGNDRQRAIEMLAAGRQLAESKGRFDLSGGSFTEDAEILDDMHQHRVGGTPLADTTVNQRVMRGALDGTGRGRIFGGHRRNIDAMAPMTRQLLDEQFGITQRANAADGGAVAAGGYAGAGHGNPRGAIEQLAFAANALDAASSNSAESARVVADQVLNQEVDLTQLDPQVLHALDTGIGQRVYRNPDGSMMVNEDTGQPVFKEGQGVTTYGALMEDMRPDENFDRLRREYGRSSLAAAASGAGAPPPDAPDPGADAAAGGGNPLEG